MIHTSVVGDKYQFVNGQMMDLALEVEIEFNEKNYEFPNENSNFITSRELSFLALEAETLPSEPSMIELYFF